MCFRRCMRNLATGFLQACSELHPRAWCRSADLWRSYEGWVQEQQEPFPLSRRAFTAQLKAHGCHADRTMIAQHFIDGQRTYPKGSAHLPERHPSFPLYVSRLFPFHVSLSLDMANRRLLCLFFCPNSGMKMASQGRWATFLRPIVGSATFLIAKEEMGQTTSLSEDSFRLYSSQNLLSVLGAPKEAQK